MSDSGNEIESGLKALEKTIADEIALRTKIRKLVQRLQSAWANGDGSVESVLKDPSIAQLRSLYPREVPALLDLVGADMSRQRAGREASLENTVRDFSKQTGQPFQGRFPRMTVAHFVEVSVNMEGGRTKVGTVSVQSLDWAKIRPVLEREIGRIWQRPFDGERFRDKVLAAYERLDARAHSPTGEVRLSDIYQQLRSENAREAPRAREGGRLSAYYKDEFCADLSKLWQLQVRGKLAGTQLEFASIRRAEEGFSVVLPSGDIATHGFVKPRRQGT